MSKLCSLDSFVVWAVLVGGHLEQEERDGVVVPLQRRCLQMS